MPISIRQFRLAAAVQLLFFLAVTPLLAAQYNSPKRVLILDSFGPSPFTAGAAAFRSTLERELGQPVDIHHATLDPARFAEPEHEAQLVDFLKARYQGKLDLVVPMLLPATEFISRHRDLFGDTPVVIAGIALRRMPSGLQTPSTTYVAAKFTAASLIENIVRLLPNTQQIVMVFGASKFEQASSSLARAEYPKLAPHVEFVWLEGLSMEDLEKRVAALSAGSVVLLGNLVVDGTGLAIDKDEGVRRLRAAAKVPLFGYFESGLGKGVVGGSLYPDVTLAVEGARLAIRILRGEALGTSEPVVINQKTPIYDWRELQRFGIPEDRLPVGSEIRYRQESLWQAYRWYIIAGVALLILQAVMITGLILQRSRRRRIEEERKRENAELLQTRGQLVHMSRVFTIGELSASLAHELNQPLTSILSNAQAAQRFIRAGDVTSLQEVGEILDDIVEADKRAGDIVRRVRSLVKKDELDAAPLDMTNAVREVSLLLHGDAVQRHVDVSLESEPALPQVQGNRIQLQQVVMNLLVNAFDAMKESQETERAVILKVGREGKRMLKVAVCDNGPGVPGDSTDRIFEAFYTTKANGLGMGLPISRSIVEAHRGRLWAENNRGRGATFYFTVPLAPQ